MKMRESAPNPITRTGIAEGIRQAFDVGISRKTFKILSKSIYKYHIRAVIREISCNAIDGHIAAGNMEAFDVYLPTDIDLRFIVRDYGTGMSDKDIMTMYRTYFASTKTDSNDFIGALGLGSKSPFSYTDTFSVESIQDGVKRGYVAYMDDGEPFIDPTYTEETDEPNGVTVTVPVQQADVAKFREEAKRVYEAFNGIKPNIVGENFPIKAQPTEPDSYGIISYQSSYYSGVYALMGNIMYPIDEDLYVGTLFNCYRSSAKNVTVIPFDLGDLDFMPSREELSLDKPTKKAINDKISAVSTRRFISLEKAFNEKKTIREKVAFYNSLSSTLQNFMAANKEFEIDGKSIDHYYNMLYVCDGSDESPLKQELTGFWANRHSASRCEFVYISNSRWGKHKYENQKKQSIAKIMQPSNQRKVYFIDMDNNRITHTLSGFCVLNEIAGQTNFIQYWGDKDIPKVQKLIKDGLFDESEIVWLKASEMLDEMALYERKYPSSERVREKRPASPTVFRYFLKDDGLIHVESLKMTKKEFVELEGMAYIKHVDEAQMLSGKKAAFTNPWVMPKDYNHFELLGITEFYMLRTCMAKWLPETKLMCMDSALRDIFIKAIKRMKPSHYQSDDGAKKEVRFLLNNGVDLRKLVGNNPTDSFMLAKAMMNNMKSSNAHPNTAFIKAVLEFRKNSEAMNGLYDQAYKKFRELNPVLHQFIEYANRWHDDIDKDNIENFKSLIKWK